MTSAKALAEAALARAKSTPAPEESDTDLALREVAEEAWDAVKADDKDAFSRAFENAILVGILSKS